MVAETPLHGDADGSHHTGGSLRSSVVRGEYEKFIHVKKQEDEAATPMTSPCQGYGLPRHSLPLLRSFDGGRPQPVPGNRQNRCLSLPVISALGLVPMSSTTSSSPTTFSTFLRFYNEKGRHVWSGTVATSGNINDSHDN